MAAGVVSFLKSRTFVVHLLLGLLFGAISLLLVYKWLEHYTHHGETLTVPDVRGMRFSELESFLQSRNLKVKVSDSSVFFLDKPPGTVVEQDPVSGSLVKEGRTVYVVVTRSLAPKIKLPNLVDVSYRQAEAILLSYGLRVGNLSYKPDLAKDAVLALSVNGRMLQMGDELSKGSTIDLLLGDGIGNTEVSVPDLIGLSLEEALFVLQGSSLNAGSISFEGSIRDSSTVKVLRQFPEPGDSVKLRQGEAVDLFLTE